VAVRWVPRSNAATSASGDAGSRTSTRPPRTPSTTSPPRHASESTGRSSPPNAATAFPVPASHTRTSPTAPPISGGPADVATQRPSADVTVARFSRRFPSNPSRTTASSCSSASTSSPRAAASWAVFSRVSACSSANGSVGSADAVASCVHPPPNRSPPSSQARTLASVCPANSRCPANASASTPAPGDVNDCTTSPVAVSNSCGVGPDASSRDPSSEMATSAVASHARNDDTAAAPGTVQMRTRLSSDSDASQAPSELRSRPRIKVWWAFFATHHASPWPLRTLTSPPCLPTYATTRSSSDTATGPAAFACHSSAPERWSTRTSVPLDPATSSVPCDRK
jgi:hypothetical protein